MPGKDNDKDKDKAEEKQIDEVILDSLENVLEKKRMIVEEDEYKDEDKVNDNDWGIIWIIFSGFLQAYTASPFTSILSLHSATKHIILISI